MIEDVLKYTPITNKHMWRDGVVIDGYKHYVHGDGKESIYINEDVTLHNKLAKSNPDFRFANFEGIEIVWHFKLHFNG